MSLTMRDGLKITLYHYHCEETNDVKSRPSLLLVHGFSEHVGRYSHVVAFLQQLGFDVWAYDARGHGVSEGTRGVIPSHEALVNDLMDVFRYVEEMTVQKPTIVAHSMGGLTAALAVTQKGLKPAALVFSSPAMRLHINWLQKILLKVGMALFPNAPLSVPAVDTDKLSHDATVGVAYRRDSLVHKKLSPRLANFMRIGGDEVRAKVSVFTMPTLLMYAGDDYIVDASGSDDLAALLTQPHVQIKRYDAGYHELFSESEPMRSQILSDLATWLKKREFVTKFP
ncbi:alpha/beta hydrolase [Hydromonas duriensis]|nr:alpha/beta hydrolase [Hydromonas duriensis]